jgi:hypothetical protein
MLDFLKAFVDKLRVDLLLGSLAVAILLFKLCGIDAWWMVFAFCVAYIGLLCIEHAIKVIREKKESKSRAIANTARLRQEEEDLNVKIWKRFYAMDSQALDLVKTIYLAPKDPTDSLTRYVQDGGTLAYEINENSVFWIPKGDRVYYPLLYAENLSHASVISFHPYFMKLIAHFVETGRKEKI